MTKDNFNLNLKSKSLEQIDYKKDKIRMMFK